MFKKFSKVCAVVGLSYLVCLGVYTLYTMEEVPSVSSDANAAALTGTVARLEAAGAGWSKSFQDQSDYPHAGKRRGTIVRVYDFSRDGGAVGTISLEKGKVFKKVPDNVIVLGGYVEVMEAISPATSTNSLGLNTSADILAVGTGLNSTGILNVIPTYDPATNSVKLTNSFPFNLTVSGSAATAGYFMVVLDVAQGQ